MTPERQQLVNKIFTELGLKQELSMDFIEIVLQGIVLFDKKQHDYGSGNIAKFGDLGVLIRCSDKVERLKTLLLSGENPEFMEESVEDTWIDIANYGFIGLMCLRNRWPLAFKTADLVDHIRERTMRDFQATGIKGPSNGPSQ